MIVAVSDIHMGTPYCSKRLFLEFLDNIVNSDNVEHFVLVGDIFDMWRRDTLKVVFENMDVLEKLETLHNEKRKIHYVVGNHDYHMIELKNLYPGFNFDISMDVDLSCGHQNYHFLHGYQFEFADNLDIYQEFADLLCMGNDEIGSTADNFWNLYQIGTSIKKDIEKRLKVDPLDMFKWPGERLNEDDIGGIKEKAKQKREEFQGQMGYTFLVYGHTHEPFVEKEAHLANTGSWVDDPSRHMLKENTYIAIEEDKPPELKEYQ